MIFRSVLYYIALISCQFFSTSINAQEKNAQGVFVSQKNSAPIFMPIVVGTTVNDKTEVKSGLTGDEQVLLSFPAGTRKASSINAGG